MERSRLTSIDLELLTPILKVYPDAAKKETEDGHLPLHVLCKNTSISLELLSALLEVNAEAVKRSDKKGMTPLHNLHSNESIAAEELPKYEDEMRQALIRGW